MEELTLVFCSLMSSVVNIGEVANGKRAHEMGASMRLIAALSPAAVFLRRSTLLIFLLGVTRV